MWVCGATAIANIGLGIGPAAGSTTKSAIQRWTPARGTHDVVFASGHRWARFRPVVTTP
jgi:hypothetical protein